MAKRKCKFKVGDVVVNINNGEICKIMKLEPYKDAVWMETMNDGHGLKIGGVGFEFYKDANSDYKLYIEQLVINDVNEFLK
jgi:hypothetical protein